MKKKTIKIISIAAGSVLAVGTAITVICLANRKKYETVSSYPETWRH